jgi:hypothetical protein
MSDSTKNEANAFLPQPAVPSRSVQRRKKRGGVVEPESSVERPNTTVVFQASPVSIAGALARTGERSGTSLTWGSRTEPRQAPTGASTARGMTPAFVVGGGRDLLRELLGSHPDLSVGPETTVLAEMTKSLESNRDRLAHEGYPEQYWYKKVGEEFAGLAADRAAEGDKARWVEFLDTDSLPLRTLDRLFPTSRVINVVADGWARRGDRSTRGAGAAMFAGRYLEVRASDVKIDPDAVRRQVLEFLSR